MWLIFTVCYIFSFSNTVSLLLSYLFCVGLLCGQLGSAFYHWYDFSSLYPSPSLQLQLHMSHNAAHVLVNQVSIHTDSSYSISVMAHQLKKLSNLVPCVRTFYHVNNAINADYWCLNAGSEFGLSILGVSNHCWFIYYSCFQVPSSALEHNVAGKCFCVSIFVTTYIFLKFCSIHFHCIVIICRFGSFLSHSYNLWPYILWIKFWMHPRAASNCKTEKGSF